MLDAAFRDLSRICIGAFGGGDRIEFKRGAQVWSLSRLRAGEVSGPADRGLVPKGYAFLVAPERGKPAPERGDLLTALGVSVSSVETFGGGETPAYFRVLAGEVTA